MKRIGYLYPQVTSIENLLLASKRAEVSKKKYRSVAEWNLKLEENIRDLHECLSNHTYKVSEYSIFKIYEPKERVISRLPFRDRVVHHAILNIIEPVLKKSFISQTYACIRGRGVHKALLDIKDALKDYEATKYCLKIDIKKFYPSINNGLLKQMLRTKFKDHDLLLLLDKVVDSCEGLPLGNYTSQWFANFFLNGFDHWMKESNGVVDYFRYCDDVVVLGPDKRALHALRKEVQKYLSVLHLQLSNYQVFLVEKRGIDFLGYRFFHRFILIRDRIKRKFKKMIRTKPKQESIAGYKGWILHCNGYNLWNKYIKPQIT